MFCAASFAAVIEKDYFIRTGNLKYSSSLTGVGKENIFIF
jgi:hypothetical protein